MADKKEEAEVEVPVKWKKINDKKYQVELSDGWKDIFVPYGKVEKLIEAFFSNGGIIDSEGKVTTSVPVLVRNFGSIGDIMLSTYDNQGNITEATYCRHLSYKEVPELFKVAADVIENFMEVVA